MSGGVIKRLPKNLAALGVGLLIAFIPLEVFLRIYNPFPFRLEGDRIVLPAGERYVIENRWIPSLPDTVFHSKNELGFRGPSWPNDPEKHLKIITVGGSTTECFYLSDGMDWPARMGASLNRILPEQAIWVNNAGMNGHSTFGHRILLEDVLLDLEPDVLLFLVGANEVSRSDLTLYDKRFLRKRTAAWKNWLIDHSEVFSLVANLRRVHRAKAWGFQHDPIDFMEAERIPVDSGFIANTLDEQIPYLDAYRQRLSELLKLCAARSLFAVVMTQPTLAGGNAQTGRDPDTGAELQAIRVHDNWNGATSTAVQDAYNEVTRELAREMGLTCLDLAAAMPKRTRYFYDFTHFTPEGSEWIGSWAAEQLAESLAMPGIPD